MSTDNVPLMQRAVNAYFVGLDKAVKKDFGNYVLWSKKDLHEMEFKPVFLDNSPRKCDCSMTALMRKGCNCGGA
jgi:hypothetical protein